MEMTAVFSAVIREGVIKLRVYHNALGIGPGNALYDYIESIERRACFAAGQMYDINRFEHSANVKIGNWCRTAIACANLDPIAQPELYSEYHDILIRNMYTQYGYAVEEYVNIDINCGALPPPPGYRISTQESHGSTRPDYVIRSSSGTTEGEVQTWLDLTSAQSSGHILRKIGAGWRNTPFVAELFYPSLNLSNISTAGDYSIAQRARLNSAIRRQETQQRLLIEHMVRCANKALGRLYSVLRRVPGNPHSAVNAAQIAGIFEEEFHYDLTRIYNHQQIVKGILVEYMKAPQNYYHATARYVIFNFYSEIQSRKGDAMRYVRDSYTNSNDFIFGEEMDRCLEAR